MILPRALAQDDKGIVLDGWELDDPLVQRGRCFCGSPISLERHGISGRVTLKHGEVALVSYSEEMLMRNVQDRTTEVFGIELLRDALTQLHA